METSSDIKAAARALVSSEGPENLSLRAVARKLEMSSSLVYYYFASRDDLLNALMVDGYHELSLVLREAFESPEATSPTDKWLAVAGTHRAWSLAHPTDYQLLFGSRLTDKVREVHQSHAEVIGVLFDVMRYAVKSGGFAAYTDTAPLSPILFSQLKQFRERWETDLDEPALAACMVLYAQLNGAITLELHRRLPPSLVGSDELFEYEMRRVFSLFVHSG